MFRILLILLFITGCSSHKTPLRVGMDPNWTEIDARGRERYLGGFTEELLLQISGYDGAPIDLVIANPDSLYEGLARGQYDVVISALPRYRFHTDRYEMSENVLSLGPVLVVAKAKRIKSLKQMRGSIAVIEGSRDGNLLSPYADLQMRTYPTANAIFEAIARDEVQGGLIPQLTAESYVHDLYADQLRIATAPLTDEGIHFTALKGYAPMHRLESAVKSLRKKKKLQELRSKWNL